MKAFPPLKAFVHWNAYKKQTINFADPKAVRALNQALLKHYYGIEQWELPADFLCPPIPGRADYIHHLAEHLSESTQRPTPKGEQVHILDIGTGASIIYPILGQRAYGWSFVGSEVNPKAIESAQKILDANPNLKPSVELRQQTDASFVLKKMIREADIFDAVLCNPPFHSSEAEALAGRRRKQKNLGLSPKAKANFGGQNNELWYPGGERVFIQKMIQESKGFATQVLWFTTLLSKKDHIDFLSKQLEINEVAEIRIVPMGQGQKQSRLLCWTFLDPERRHKWAKIRWTTKPKGQ